MDIRKFCCICIEPNKTLESVVQEDNNSIKYYEKLTLCDASQNWCDENLSICEKCSEKLNLVYEFILRCKQSQSLRNERLEQLQREKEKANVQDLLICDICKKSFKQKRFLKLHITKIHKTAETHEKSKKSKRDEKENKETSDEDLVDKEKGNDNIVKPFHYSDDNNEDDDIFQDNYSDGYDTDHIQRRKSDRKRFRQKQDPFTCSYCGKLFKRRQHWSAHIRSIHTFEKPYKCNLCEASFSISHSLLVHTRNHNNEKPYVCSTCGKRFVCSGDLNHHNKIHLNKRDYQCNICDKRFNTSSILRTHKIVKHTDPEDWKYVCAVCHRRFSLNSGLVVHMKRHTGVKDYSCHICGKKFFNKSEVTKHILTHSNERHFKCIHCSEKEYKNKEGLNKHLKIVHNIGNWKQPKLEKKYLCPMCPKMFSFNNKLQRHILSHTGEKPFKCEYCEKRFVDNYYRKVHLKKEHNLDLDDIKFYSK